MTIARTVDPNTNHAPPEATVTSPPLFYTTREAAYAARKDVETIRRAIRAGKLRAGRTGDLGDFVIQPADLREWLGLPGDAPLPALDEALSAE